MKSNNTSQTNTVKTDCQFKCLRGLCISLIVLHNLIHNVCPYLENEKVFYFERAQYFIDNYPSHWILSLISYYGWLGVPVFFFFSGYGLTRKYDNAVIHSIRFIVRHFVKLLLLASPFIVLMEILKQKSILSIVCNLLFVKNILGGDVNPAAYWYLGVLMQFYIIYAFMSKISCIRYKYEVLFAIGIVICTGLYFCEEDVSKYIKNNCLGWIVSFSSGCILGKNTLILNTLLSFLNRYIVRILLLSFLVFCGLNSFMWCFIDIIAVLFFLSIANLVENRLFCFLGGYSAIIYAVHPLVRDGWLLLDLDYMSQPINTGLYCALYFLITICISWVYKKYIYVHLQKLTLYINI